jgi:hypothetical protein
MALLLGGVATFAVTWLPNTQAVAVKDEGGSSALIDPGTSRSTDGPAVPTVTPLSVRQVDWNNTTYAPNPCTFLDGGSVAVTNGKGQFSGPNGASATVQIRSVVSGDLNHNTTPDAAIQVLCTPDDPSRTDRYVYVVVAIDDQLIREEFSTPDSEKVLLLSQPLRIQDGKVYIATCYETAEDGKPCFDDVREWDGTSLKRTDDPVVTYAPPS